MGRLYFLFRVFIAGYKYYRNNHNLLLDRYVKKDPVAIAFVQAYANVLQEQKKLKDQLRQKNLN